MIICENCKNSTSGFCNKHLPKKMINKTKKWKNGIRAKYNLPPLSLPLGSRTKALPKEILAEFQNLPKTNMTTEQFLSKIYNRAYEEGKKSAHTTEWAKTAYIRGRKDERAELEEKVMEAMPEEKEPDKYDDRLTVNAMLGWNGCRSQLLANIKKIFEE